MYNVYNEHSKYEYICQDLQSQCWNEATFCDKLWYEECVGISKAEERFNMLIALLLSWVSEPYQLYSLKPL